MATAADALNAKPPLGATLAQGVEALSANQEISFALYRRYVFPLDGMNYWIRCISSDAPISTAGLRLRRGLATATKVGGEAVQVAPGGPRAAGIVGGTIYNPVDPVDQGMDALIVDPRLFPDPDPPVAESIFVDFTGPAACQETATTAELQPGENLDIPAGSAAWVNAATGGHKFSVVLHEAAPVVSLPTDVTVMGSLHYDSMTEQRVDATVDSNTVVFTALSEVQPFNQIGPDFLYIASYRDIRFAFASRGFFYEQADLYHYVGKAIYSVTATQVIDDPETFEPEVFNSDSTPIWMYLNYYVPPYPGGFTCPFPLYPSFLVDDNTPPPFGAVHVEYSTALASVPLTGRDWSASQLCRDRVIIHMYGVSNRLASDFREFIEQYSKDWSTIGIATAGAITDQKHQQAELKVIAQRKSVVFEVNYLQSVVRDLARQYIEHVRVQFLPNVPGLGDEYAANYVSAPV